MFGQTVLLQDAYANIVFLIQGVSHKPNDAPSLAQQRLLVVGFGSCLKLPSVRIGIRVVVSGGVRPVTAEASDSNLVR